MLTEFRVTMKKDGIAKQFALSESLHSIKGLKDTKKISREDIFHLEYSKNACTQCPHAFHTRNRRAVPIDQGRHPGHKDQANRQNGRPSTGASIAQWPRSRRLTCSVRIRRSNLPPGPPLRNEEDTERLPKPALQTDDSEPYMLASSTNLLRSKEAALI